VGPDRSAPKGINRMNSSESTSRINGFISLVFLLFGGAFPGIVLLAVANQFNGWPVAVLWFFGTAIWANALRESFKRKAILAAVALAAVVYFIFQLLLIGIAALAASGTYGSDNSSPGYSNAEYYLTIAILWLVFGVPQRAFRFELDLYPHGEGTIQDTLVTLLARTAAFFTGIYIFLLHFGNGPLSKKNSNINTSTLIVGIVFTIVLLVPAYKSLARTCWQYGIRGTLSLQPLRMRWSKTLTELDALDQEAQRELQQLLESHGKPDLESGSTALGASNAQKSPSGQGPSLGGAPPVVGNSKGTRKTAVDTSDARKSVSMQRLSHSETRPARRPPKWTRPTRRS
jgi:hypothetical protein